MEKKQPHVKDIGTLNGKLFVFGGVYSNLQALQECMEIADSLGISPENRICTGDMIGYCAQPRETIEWLKNSSVKCIAGNVEIQLREGQDDCGCNFSENSRCDLFSRQWFPYAQQRITDSDRAWMQDLPEILTFSYAGKPVCVLHGGYFETAGYIFASTAWERKQSDFEASGSEVILAGHSGIPFQDVHDGRYWLNAGVIGMPPNDGKTGGWFLLLDDTDGFTFSFHRFEYDHRQAAKRMREANLPEAYAHTLETGVWDNCEILPETERRQQGIPILL